MKDEAGVAGLIIAGIIAVVAFSALSVFLNKYIGDRSFERARGTSSGQGRATSALTAYFLSNLNAGDPTYKMVCPDTNYDGRADGSCETASTVYKGVVPWLDVGLTRDEVLDAYGNFYTYLVSGSANGGSATERGICDSLTSDYDSLVEFTGELRASDIELIDTTQTAGGSPTQGRNVPYVLISHGKNQLGAISASGTARSPATATYETINDNSSPTTVYTGPENSGTDSAVTYFDDKVYAPSQEELEKTCQRLMPGGGLNTDINDGFDSAATTQATFGSTAPTGVTIVTKGGNRVARFTGNSTTPASLTTQASFNPSVRPIYTSLKWNPNPTYASGTASTHATISGLSVSTRNTSTDRATTYPFDRYNANTFAGITFRFYNAALGTSISGAGVNNTISIFQYNSPDAATAVVIGTSATTFSLRSNATYIVEVYDDGENVWARITEDGNTANTTEVRGSTTADHTGNQGVSLIAQSDVTPLADIDDVVLGKPMLALETTGTASAIYANASVNGPTDEHLSVEAWIRPRGLPTAGNFGVIVGQWNTASVGTSSYRVYLDSAGALHFQMAGDHFGLSSVAGTETFALGISPELDEWTHIALTFDATGKSVRSYKNGQLARVGTSTTTAGFGVRDGAVPFGIGADFNGGVGAPVDGYNGDVSDVRVWTDVRTSAEILRYYKRRLVSALSPTTTGMNPRATDIAEVANLAVNWQLDSESGNVNTTVVTATPSASATPTDPLAVLTYGSGSAGSTGARYVPALSVYFRPNAREFCPSGSRTRLYQCDLRVSTDLGQTSFITIPSRLSTVFAKVWGAGGGGYDPTGTSDDSVAGSGGFSAGLIRRINSTPIAGQQLTVVAGGYGVGSGTTNTAGAGGAGSGVYLSTNPGVVAGGGGGASYSNAVLLLDGLGNCSLTTGAARCGVGGGGGGVGALTTRAPSSTASCGGRGGDNSPTAAGSPPTLDLLPPIISFDCDEGGGDPSGRQGGGLLAGGGGGPSFLAGGSAYTGDGTGNAIGGGGGGGGAIGGEAGGYNNAADTRGYGGGGGSGTADAGVTNTSGAAGSITFGGGFTDSTRTGTYGSGSKVISVISPSLLNAPLWVAGCTIASPQVGTGNNNVIATVDSSSQITLVDFPTGSATPHSETLTVTCPSTTSTVPGGTTDPYYSPTYLTNFSSLQNPGVGGSTGTTGNNTRNGRGGAVILLW